MNTRTIERVDVFPTRLPVVKTFASGSAGTAGGTAPHVFARVTDSQGRGAHGSARLVRASCDLSLRSYLGGSDDRHSVEVALVFGFEGPAALNGSQFIDESAVSPDKAHIEFDGVVHLGNGPGIGVE